MPRLARKGARPVQEASPHLVPLITLTHIEFCFCYCSIIMAKSVLHPYRAWNIDTYCMQLFLSPSPPLFLTSKRENGRKPKKGVRNV